MRGPLLSGFWDRVVGGVSGGLAALVACGLLIVAGGEARATSLGIESVTAGVGIASNEARGYRFRAEQDLLVTGLALFDVGENGIGIEGSYDLHLWTDTGILLATGTLDHGDEAPLFEGFRIVTIPSVLLDAGDIYRVSVDFGDGAGGDELLLNPTEVVTHDAITLIANVGTGEATLADFGLRGPDDSFPTQPDFPTIGPNLVFSVVPEPGTGVLLAAGLVVLGARRGRSVR